MTKVMMDISFRTSVMIHILVFLTLTSLHVCKEDPDDALILRLQKTTTLEVRYKGKWGSICYSKPGFDNNAANVSCRQMGFRSGAFYGKTLPTKTSGIVLQKVICTGQEDAFSKCELTAPNSASICEDAVQVECTSDPALVGLFDVRLIGNPNKANKGILQATKKSASPNETPLIAAVCHDSGTAPTVAGIVCKQMGFLGVEKQTAANASSYSSFFNATCKGAEQTLADCTMTLETSCSSNNVIDVECKLDISTQATLDVRLSQSSHAMTETNKYGTVEVKRYGIWGVICDTGWDINEANVVCRQLGFSGAVPTTGFPTKAKFGQGTGIVVWNNMKCSGDEQSMAECKHDEVFGMSACDSVNASGVICSKKEMPEPSSTSISEGEVSSTTSSGNRLPFPILDGPTPEPVNLGVIIGTVVGVVVVIAVIIFVVLFRKKIRKYIIPGNRRDSSVRSQDDSHNGNENKGFKKSDDDLSAAPGFKGTGGIDVITETGFITDESKEPETGERKQNGGISRPASNSEVKVDIDKPAFNAYEMEEQPQSNGNPYEFEGPGKDDDKPLAPASADNANNQTYAAVNKAKRGQKGPAFVTPNETPNPGPEPHAYVYANSLKQDIDNGNINDDFVPPVEYGDRKPQTFVPGQSSAYADIEFGAGGAPSILEQGPPVSENKTKKDKKKKKREKEKGKEKDKEGDKKEAKKGEGKRGKKGDNKENKNEENEAGQKEDRKKSQKKDKKGDKTDGKKKAGSSDDISGQRPVGDSYADPMSGDFNTYAEVGKETGRIGPAGGCQPDESENAYDVFNRKGPNFRPGVSDPTYGVVQG